MTGEPLKTLLVGFGRIAARHADDPVMAARIPFATHAQVLRSHPAFDWCAAVDPSPEARELAERRWGIATTAAAVEDLPEREACEVAVVTSPPEARRDILASLPRLRAVLVEKPLGVTLADAEMFVSVCRDRGILVQVNLTRRADPTMRELADGGLGRRLGVVQAAFGIYGNGLLNNGTHMVDLVRMLLGEIEAVQAISPSKGFIEGPIPGDVNLPFVLRLEAGPTVVWQPIRFARYRECSLDLWGERARLQIVHEGLELIEYRMAACRSLQRAMEVAADRPLVQPTEYGVALYRMYDNLAGALAGRETLVSPGESALQTARAIHAILDSARQEGRLVHPRPGLAVH